MIKTPIRVGLIGANAAKGWAAGTHLPALAALDEFKLTAVCTTNAESAKQSAAKYGAAHAFTDAATLSACPDVDLVVVSVKAPQHHANVRTALEAGKHVLCEWPLGVSVEQSQNLCDLAEKKGVRTFVALQGYAAVAVQYARHLIGQGYLGKILSATGLVASHHFGGETLEANQYSTDRKNGVGIDTILSAHGLDMMCHLAGEVTSVSGLIASQWTETKVVETGQTIPKTSTDQAAFTATLTSGAIAMMHGRGGVKEHHRCLLEFHGTAGTLRLSSDAGPEIMPVLLEGTQTSGGPLKPIEIPASFHTIPASLTGPAINIAYLYKDIASDLRDGTHRAPDFRHSVMRRKVIAAVERASETGTRQML